MRIYISGKITGIEEEAEKLFSEAEKRLKRKGYEVVNPIKLPHEHDGAWHSFMQEDIQELLMCDEVYMLRNWVDSKGAKLEHDIAVNNGLKVIYEN